MESKAVEIHRLKECVQVSDVDTEVLRVARAGVDELIAEWDS